ncbi:putative ribonuclease H-like domain-containing protein [Tanacetum coccineum]
MDGLDALLENGPWFIQNNPLILKKWHTDENLLKEDVSNVPVWVKLHGVPVTTFSKDGLSDIATKLDTPLMLDSYTSLKDNIVMAMPKITGEGHYICNVRVEYEWKPPRPVPKKHTASSSSKKKKSVEPNIEVNNSNPFEVLNSVDNDVELGNFEELLTSGQAILVDEVGNPLKKVEFSGDYDSEVEAASVDNDMAHSMASERVGQDLPQEIQVVCDNLDIRVRDTHIDGSLEITKDPFYLLEVLLGWLSLRLINKVGSMVPLEKLLCGGNFDNSSYHALGSPITCSIGSSTSCEVFGIVRACEDECVGVGAESAVVVDAFDSNTTAKLPILKLAQENGTSVTKMSVPITAEEKTNKKNDVKARSLLLMALPNEHQLTFIWMNKADIETMSINDLYNNFKIVEQDVKKSVSASSGAQILAYMTAPSTSSTNDVNTANPAYEVSIVSPNINTACPQDLKQIHEDDLEAMDLKWQLSLLSMRAKRYFQRTGKKIFINANDTAGYDKSKVECFNCHKMGHFVRECRAPRNKEGQFRYQDNTRKQGNNEDTSSKAMLAIDGVGFDWSDMAEEQVQTNMAPMVFSDSEVYNDKTCTKTCLKNYETLKKQCDYLIVKLNQTEFTAATYKRGLTTVEEQLVTYRKNAVLFSEEVTVLKREVTCKDYEINVLKSEFEKVKQEKEGIGFKIEKFNNASKSLDKLLGSQITDKSKKGLGYNTVPPPYPLIYNGPTKLDLSYYGLDEFKDPEFKSYGSKDSKLESNIVCDKKSDDSKENSNDSLVKEQVSEDTSSFVESPLNVDKETVFLVDKKIEFVKPKNHEKPVKKSVRYAEMYRSQSPRGNQRNWNGQKSNQLGSDFVMYNKACFICGSFDHVQAHCKYHQRERMVYGNNYNRVNYNYTTNRTHPNAQRNMVPRAVLMKTGLKPFNTARTVNTAHPKSTVISAKPMSRFSKLAQSTVRRESHNRMIHDLLTVDAQGI